MIESHQFCTFLVDKFLFGIEVEKVQEVIRFQSMTRVPLAPSTISGLINLRGQIVTAIDLRRRLELPNATVPTDSRMNVVIQTQDGAVSLLVDAIGGVIVADASAYEDLPETLTGLPRELIRGAYKLKDRLLLALDIDKITNIQGV